MRLAAIIAVLVAAPAMAGTYTFDITGGSLALSIEGVGSTSSGVQGSFDITVEDSGGHIAESDMITLGAANISNSDAMVLAIPGVATANVAPGDAGILEFLQPAPAHVGAGGVAAVETDAFLDATVIVTGPINTTFATSTSAGELLPLTVTLTTSAGVSDTISAVMAFTFVYSEYIPDIGMTLTLDLIMTIEGEAHAVPEPTFGGLTAMGLAGAGAWLRRRRS